MMAVIGCLAIAVFGLMAFAMGSIILIWWLRLGRGHRSDGIFAGVLLLIGAGLIWLSVHNLPFRLEWTVALAELAITHG